MPENVKGTGHFFSFKEDKTLTCTQAVDIRVCPHDRNLKLPDTKASGPLFIKCRIFHLPKQMKGNSVAFLCSEYPNVWKFGYISCLVKDNKFMEIFVWNGPTELDNSTNEAKIYPSFYFMDKSFFESQRTEDCDPDNNFIWQSHFSLLNLNLNEVIKMFFNQIDGRRPIICDDHSSILPLLNPNDIAYEQSVSGLDRMWIPSIPKEHFCSIEKSKCLLLVSDNELQKLPKLFSPRRKRNQCFNQQNKLPHFYQEPNTSTMAHLPVDIFYVKNVEGRNII